MLQNNVIYEWVPKEFFLVIIEPFWVE